MADVHSKAIRSYNMSRIRSKDTKPEILVRKYLHKNGFRYRLNVKTMPGKPDIVLPRFKTVIFIHGCFWHGHDGCRYFVIPKTRTEWWVHKIQNNKNKDFENAAKLTEDGWEIIEIWECDLRKPKVQETLDALNTFLKEKRLNFSIV